MKNDEVKNDEVKNRCINWKGRLLDAALGEMGTASAELQDHLSRCPDCAAELAGLRARRESLESLLPRLASATEPSPELCARIVAAAEAATSRRHPRLGRVWAVTAPAAIVLVLVLVTIGLVVTRAIVRRTRVTEAELHGAQALAQWRAPTDVFLRTPGQEFLNSTPNFGGSYITIPILTKKGGR